MGLLRARWRPRSPRLPVLWAYRLAGEIGIACVCIAMRHQIPEPMPKSYVDAANERNTVTFAESLLIIGLLKQKRKSINYVYSARARARDACARACTVLLLVIVRIQCSCSCVYSANMTITNKQNGSYNYQLLPHNKNKKSMQTCHIEFVFTNSTHLIKSLSSIFGVPNLLNLLHN